MTRPPTISEAVDWLNKMAHNPQYCRTCLQHWKSIMGSDEIKNVFSKAPESVRRYCLEMASK